MVNNGQWCSIIPETLTKMRGFSRDDPVQQTTWSPPLFVIAWTPTETFTDVGCRDVQHAILTEQCPKHFCHQHLSFHHWGKERMVNRTITSSISYLISNSSRHKASHPFARGPAVMRWMQVTGTIVRHWAPYRLWCNLGFRLVHYQVMNEQIWSQKGTTKYLGLASRKTQMHRKKHRELPTCRSAISQSRAAGG